MCIYFWDIHATISAGIALAGMIINLSMLFWGKQITALHDKLNGIE